MHRRNLRVDIDFLAKSLEEAGSLSVGKQVLITSSEPAAQARGQCPVPVIMMIIMLITIGNIGERLKLEGETENMGV